jgi:hypothetical protein
VWLCGLSGLISLLLLCHPCTLASSLCSCVYFYLLLSLSLLSDRVCVSGRLLRKYTVSEIGGLLQFLVNQLRVRVSLCVSLCLCVSVCVAPPLL